MGEVPRALPRFLDRHRAIAKDRRGQEALQEIGKQHGRERRRQEILAEHLIHFPQPRSLPVAVRMTRRRATMDENVAPPSAPPDTPLIAKTRRENGMALLRSRLRATQAPRRSSTPRGSRRLLRRRARRAPGRRRRLRRQIGEPLAEVAIERAIRERRRRRRTVSAFIRTAWLSLKKLHTNAHASTSTRIGTS